MFDLSAINKRYFEIKINEIVLEVEPPKVKTLKKIVNLQKNARREDGLDDMTDAVIKLLSKNKDRREVPVELIDDLDFDELSQILTAFFEWLTGVKNSKN